MINIINSDCLHELKKIQSKKFNVVLTDPPYNVAREYNKYDDNLILDEYYNWCSQWFNELIRVSETVVMTVGYKNLKFWFNKNPKHMMIWHKPNQNSPSPLGGFNAYEPVLFWGKNQKRIGHDIFTTNISMQSEASWHNCPKHLNSWVKLLSLISNEGDYVLDPFSGSGTTAIACHKLKMDFMGFEIDEYYYKKSYERLKKYTNQTELF